MSENRKSKLLEIDPDIRKRLEVYGFQFPDMEQELPAPPLIKTLFGLRVNYLWNGLKISSTPFDDE